MTEVRAGSVVHVEFSSDDPASTRRFLSEVFGWEFVATPEPEYFVYAAPTGPGGAVLPAANDRPQGILNYVLSTDLARDLAKAVRAGGTVRVGRSAMAMGWWAVIEDPSGLVLALFRSASPTRGPVARYR